MTDHTSPRSRWQQLRDYLLNPRVDKEALDQALAHTTAQQPPPVLWLLGKTQSGKTSIIRALTGSSDAEIGNGFQPCTRTARFYDFPADAPLVRFLDTRGLGEVAYDPQEDIAFCEAQAHLVMAVVRVSDANPSPIWEVLRAVRRRHPDWPVVLVQTCLHQVCPADWEHPTPYPFSAPLDELPNDDLKRALQHQRESLGRLPGQGKVFWRAVDFTPLEDGFADQEYGLDALWQAVDTASAFGLQQQLQGDAGLRDVFSKAAHPHIVSYSLAAGGLGAVPLVDLALVPAVQAKLLHTLARIYEQPWDSRTVTEFFSFLGLGVAAGYGLHWAGRNAIKMVPVWGQTLGAAWGASSAAGLTFALGKSASYYLDRRRQGQSVDEHQLRDIYTDALRRGRKLAKESRESREHMEP